MSELSRSPGCVLPLLLLLVAAFLKERCIICLRNVPYTRVHPPHLLLPHIQTFASLIRTHSRRTTNPTQQQQVRYIHDLRQTPAFANSYPQLAFKHPDHSIIGVVLPDYANNTMLTSRESEAILNPVPRKSENKVYWSLPLL
jgi:hypothetical protein